jgi:hypothetical protein
MRAEKETMMAFANSLDPNETHAACHLTTMVIENISQIRTNPEVSGKSG